MKNTTRWIHMLAGILLLLIVDSSFMTAYSAQNEINIKLFAVNPSETEPLSQPIEHHLPPEVQPEDVIDRAGMDISYDPALRTYKLAKIIDLAPKEVKTIEIKIRNVWTLDPENIENVRNQVTAKLEALRGTDYYDAAKSLFDRVLEQLSRMEEEEAQDLGMRRQIELYRAHIRQLNDIQSDILSFETIRQEKILDGQQPKVISFIVNGYNPADEPRMMTVRADLPKEITPDHIVDRLDFLLLYDKGKSVYVVEKEELYQGKERKKYEILIKDLWQVDSGEVDYLEERMEKLLPNFIGSSFASYAEQNGVYIKESLQTIRELQSTISSGASIDERMKVLSLVNQKLRIVKKRLRELQDLLMELPIKRIEKNIFGNIAHSPKQFQKVSDANKILTMGIDPDKVTTWWLIIGIIIFVAVLALVFYVTWMAKLKKKKV